MTLWEQYNPERALAEVLSEATGLALQHYEEKVLFALLKRQLTRRELRCFVLEMSAMERSEMAAVTRIPLSQIDTQLQSVHAKFRQPKFRRLLLSAAPDGEVDL